MWGCKERSYTSPIYGVNPTCGATDAMLLHLIPIQFGTKEDL
jgi:hypothetical protein